MDTGTSGSVVGIAVGGLLIAALFRAAWPSCTLCLMEGFCKNSSLFLSVYTTGGLQNDNLGYFQKVRRFNRNRFAGHQRKKGGQRCDPPPGTERDE